VKQVIDWLCRSIGRTPPLREGPEDGGDRGRDGVRQRERSDEEGRGPRKRPRSPSPSSEKDRSPHRSRRRSRSRSRSPYGGRRRSRSRSRGRIPETRSRSRGRGEPAGSEDGDVIKARRARSCPYKVRRVTWPDDPGPHPPGPTCPCGAVEQDCLRDRQPGHRCRRFHSDDRDFVPELCKSQEACTLRPSCRFYHRDEVDKLQLEPKARLRSVVRQRPCTAIGPPPPER
jgi:hypothetical protein